MSNYPDDFSAAAFDAAFPPEPSLYEQTLIDERVAVAKRIETHAKGLDEALRQMRQHGETVFDDGYAPEEFETLARDYREAGGDIEAMRDMWDARKRSTLQRRRACGEAQS